MFVTGKMSYLAKENMQAYKPGHILPVLKSETLLGSGRHQAVVQQLQDISGMDPDYFALLYEPVLNNFVEYVQVLPSTHKAILCGLMNEGLARATIGLRNYTSDHPDSNDPLLNYAVFTAGLLAHVSRVLTNQKIVICDEEGVFIENWNPLHGSMVEHDAEYYKIYPLAPIYQRLDASVTSLLARQIIPADGFDWLTSDLLIFADWLDALRGDGSFGGAISRALTFIRREDIFNMVDSLPQVDVDMMESEATLNGELFFEWLKEGIDKGDISINNANSDFFIVERGALITNELMERYREGMAQVISEQLSKMFGLVGEDVVARYISTFESHDVRARRFASPFSHSEHTFRTGVMIGDHAQVFMHAQIPASTPMLKDMQPKMPKSHQLPTTVVEKAQHLTSSQQFQQRKR